MFFQSIKTKIAANLAFILLLSILLTDFVIIRIVENNLLQGKVAQAHHLLSIIAHDIAKGPGSDTAFAGYNAIDRNIAPMLSDSSFIYAHIRSINNEKVYFGTLPEDIGIDVEKININVMRSGEPVIRYSGSTWGIFWQQNKYLTISEPFAPDSKLDVTGTIICQLDGIYLTLRKSQKIVAFYAFANFLIFLFFGLHRLSMLVVKPIRKFITMTEEYRDTDRLYFATGKKHQEFNKLSNALNRMLEKIENDKKKLQESLKSLEKANAHLKKAQHDIIKAEKLAAIGRLSAGFAHEIGNPIGIVLGYLDLLKSNPKMKDDPIVSDYIIRAENEINRIDTIIRQLLDFSRVSPVNLNLISVHDLVRDVVKIMSDQPLMAQIQIDYNLSASEDTIYADYDQFRQVLLNLMINAADSITMTGSKAGGRIRLVTEIFSADDEMALDNQPALALKVIDNGSGIKKEDIDNIFDPFYTTKEPGKGTGLGLFVSYMIIEQIGGTITAHSEAGEGATITLCLPLNNKK